MADEGVMLSRSAARRLSAMLRWFEARGDTAHTSLRRQPPDVAPLWWGKLAADWDAATPNAVTVNPCREDGTGTNTAMTVTVYLRTPVAGDPGLSDLVTGDVIAFIRYWDISAVKYCGVYVGGGLGGPGLWGKATAIWQNDATATGNGSYVNVNPCDRDGSNVDTGVTHKVWLPRNGRREDPNVQYEAVISYVPEEGGDFVNPSGLLDGKIYETVRIHLDMTNIPGGWSSWDAAKDYDLRAWGDANPPGNTGGQLPFNTGAPSLTISIAEATTGPTVTAAHATHTHEVNERPPHIYVGLIWRTS